MIKMTLQTIRIVCVSDTHNETPHLPPGDILIHAGDLSQQGTPEELAKVIKWLEAANFRLKIVTAGNHDACLDPKSRIASRQDTADAAKAMLDAMRESPYVHYLEHESKLLRLVNDDGTEIKLKVFGSPYTPGRRSRAFGYGPEDAQRLWDDIPLDADIVITHTPAKYHLDESTSTGSVGCPRLREALWRTRPKLLVCGHIHAGRGVQVVEWDLDSPHVKFKEATVRAMPHQTGDCQKTFRVNLASTSTQPLRNDGSHGDLVPGSPTSKLRGVELDHHNVCSVAGLPTRGQGGNSGSVCTDREALLGREGRSETLFVNASFMISRSRRAGRTFQKPVVVDLDFPVLDHLSDNAVLVDEKSVYSG